MVLDEQDARAGEPLAQRARRRGRRGAAAAGCGASADAAPASGSRAGSTASPASAARRPAAAPALARSASSRANGGDQQDARPRLRMALDDAARAGHAVHARHLPVEQDPAVGGRARRRRSCSACAPLVGAVDGDAQPFEHAAEHFERGGVVVGQQRAPAAQLGGAEGARRRGARALRPKRALKWKVEPWPGSLSTHSRPPMRSTSWRRSTGPRPVPPKRRVVELSACMKGWNTRDSCSAVMPTPVSRTQPCSSTLCVVLRQQLHADRHFAARR